MYVKENAHCDVLNDTFPIAYSILGISRFGCPRVTREKNMVCCGELTPDNPTNPAKCSEYEKLEKAVASMQTLLSKL